MGKGFLGTSASIMLDVVVCSLTLIVPALATSIYLVKRRRLYGAHRALQIGLGLMLAIVVLLFEVDMRLQGGFWAMAKDSRYFGTAFLEGLLAVHIAFSVSTVVLWGVTTWTALRQFPHPPAPGPFSRRHKRLAWSSVGAMIATVVTGLMVYFFGFVTV